MNHHFKTKGPYLSLLACKHYLLVARLIFFVKNFRHFLVLIAISIKLYKLYSNKSHASITNFPFNVDFNAPFIFLDIWAILSFASQLRCCNTAEIVFVRLLQPGAKLRFKMQKKIISLLYPCVFWALIYFSVVQLESLRLGEEKNATSLVAYCISQFQQCPCPPPPGLNPGH